MRRPKICGVVTDCDIEAVRSIQQFVDLFEVRIDLIGDRWTEVAGELKKPWIACNRLPEEGGRWHDSEARRVEKLLLAVGLGASIVDIELRTKNLENVVAAIKKRAGCLISSHDIAKTPCLEELRMVVSKQVKAGADICKVVTTAVSFQDNLTVMQLVSGPHSVPLVSFAMGPLGILSRVLCPALGGHFTYASIACGKESAPGQITVQDLAKLYEMLEVP